MIAHTECAGIVLATEALRGMIGRFLVNLGGADRVLNELAIGAALFGKRP